MSTRLRAALGGLATSVVLACLLSPATASAGVIVSPQPGTLGATPSEQISFLGASARSLSSISVVGSTTGSHRGHLRSYVSKTGASFIPAKGFAPGENVRVSATWRGPHGHRVRLRTSFSVSARAAIPEMEFPATPGTPADVQNFHAEPELHPPVVTVHTAAGAATAPGYLFGAPFLGPAQWGPMIFDSTGNLVWFRRVPAGDDAADFRTQNYHGHQMLTWWQGRTLTFGFGIGEDLIADANYRIIAHVHAGNGLSTDEHEFNITPQGTATLLAYNPVQANLSSVGSFPNGIALDGIVQEVDIRTGLVMWEWHALGHVELTESYSKAPGLVTNPYDYFHINSVQTDRHGNLLVSARNTWGIYDINHHSGAIMWRLGGKKSTFTLGPGVAFAFQHNAEWQPDGTLSLFDDEGAPPVAPPSRGEVVKLDTAKRTATLVRSFVRTPPVTTNSQGNTQALPGGGWMLGWGGLPNFTEFDSSGAVIYDAQFPPGEFSYRVYRLPWSGQPRTHPAIVARSAGATNTVYASWNGATTVASWQLLTGPSHNQLTPVSTTPRSGFETTIPAPPAAVYQVRALNTAGHPLGTSKAVGPTSG
jgi:arylsulfotransferase ASST